MGRLAILGYQLLSIAALVAMWEAVVRAGVADPLFVPAPSAVAVALAGATAEALPRMADTLVKTLLGYALAAAVGITAGLLIGGRRLLHEIVMPYVVALYGIPKILVLPWIALVLG